MHEKDSEYTLARQNNQPGTVEENECTTSLRTTSKKKMELDRTHPETKRRQHCQTSATVDATRPQRKRTTEKHLEKRSGEGNVDGGASGATGGRWRQLNIR